MSKSSLESGYGSTNDDFIPEPNLQRIQADKTRLENSFIIEKLLMNSANGRIYTGIDCATKEKVIFKQIPRVTCTTWSKFEGHLVPSEVAYHFQASKFDDFDVIVRPLTWMEKRSSFVLVMEYVENSIDLFDLTQKYGTLNDEAVCIIFRQIVQMLKVLEKGGICHRDIKDENIVINLTTLQVKLIDFGCATQSRTGQLVDFSGTPEFYPPEFWLNKKYTQIGLSVWSVGIVLYILVNGKLPYEGVREIPFYNVENDLSVQKTSDNVQTLLLHTLKRNPLHRPTLSDLEAFVANWEKSFSV